MKGALKSRPLQIAVSFVLAALLLAFFVRGLDVAEIGRQISSADAGWLVASILLAITTFFLRALRWTWLLRPVARVPFYPAFVATAFGFAANNLPGKVGEVLRPALLARSRGLPFSPLLASVLLERVFDGAAVLFFFLIAAGGGLPNSTGLGKLLVPAVLLLVLVGVVLFSVFQRSATERFLEKLWRRLPERFQPKARSFAETFVDGFASLKDPRLLLLVVAGTLAMWFVINVQIYAVLRAFHLDLPFTSSFVVTAAAVLGLMFPTPGGSARTTLRCSSRSRTSTASRATPHRASRFSRTRSRSCPSRSSGSRSSPSARCPFERSRKSPQASRSALNSAKRDLTPSGSDPMRR